MFFFSVQARNKQNGELAAIKVIKMEPGKNFYYKYFFYYKTLKCALKDFLPLPRTKIIKAGFQPVIQLHLVNVPKLVFNY